MKDEKLSSRGGIKRMGNNNSQYYCERCWYIYDDTVGDPEGYIPQGTKFEDLPETWVCPDCGCKKAFFFASDGDGKS